MNFQFSAHKYNLTQDDILEIYIKNSTMKETFLFLTRELMDNNQR